MSGIEIQAVSVEKPEEMNFIFGQSHFIKTVEDIYEMIVTSQPSMKFGVAFCEASGPRLIRFCGNDEILENIAVENAKNVGCGHSFFLFMKDGFPINILNQLKMIPEICHVFCATANPTQILVAETEQGKGVVGVIDGGSPLGVETEKDKAARHDFLRAIKYKL